MMLVALDEPVETLGRSFPAGTRFKATGWVETDQGEFCDLFDSWGVRRVSHCPADRVRVVLEEADGLGAGFTTEARRHEEETEACQIDHTVKNVASRSESWSGMQSPAPPAPTVQQSSCRSKPNAVPVKEPSVNGSSLGASESFTTTHTAQRRLPPNPNAELQLLADRTPRVSPPRVERERLPSRPGGGPLIETPRPPWSGAVSATHPRLAEWGPEWAIAEHGWTWGERVVFAAENDTITWTTGKPHPTVIDLDRGEFMSSTGWQDLTTGVTSDEPFRVDGDRQVPASGVHRHASESPDCRARRDLLPEGSRGALGRERGIPGGVDTLAPQADPEKRASDSPNPDSERNRVCGYREYPAPACGMTVDQLRGHRRVRDDGRIVSRFGPDHPDDFERFREWCRALREFREQLGAS